MISDSRLLEVMLYYNEHGKKSCMQKYNLNKESIERYVRLYNQRGARLPKILLLDIETSPNVSWNWSFWKQDIRYQQLIYPWILISWVAKWLYAPENMGDVLTRREAIKHDDSRISKSLLKLFNEADIIIAHNGKKFDDKRSKTRFFLNKFNPPTPYRLIDTYQELKKEFVMPSNRLDYLAHLLYDDSKMPTEFALWPKCLNWFGRVDKDTQQEALDNMLEYNKKDVYILEELYLSLRPWIKSHPNVGVFMETTKPVCYKCGSTDLYVDGEYATPLNKYYSLRCRNCGGIGGRERVSNLTGKQRKALLGRTPV